MKVKIEEITKGVMKIEITVYAVKQAHTKNKCLIISDLDDKAEDFKVLDMCSYDCKQIQDTIRKRLSK